jgi:hypothetical protein
LATWGAIVMRIAHYFRQLVARLTIVRMDTSCSNIELSVRGWHGNC